MGLRIPYTKIEQPTDHTLPMPAVITQLAVESIDAFELRRLNPLEFSKKELAVLERRFFLDFTSFAIYFFPDAINEKYSFPQHLTNIGQQLIGYYRYNLIVAPRGFSKSTIISGIFPIREIVYHMKKYIIIVSETTDIASDFTETVRHELEVNERLRMFFGKFRSKKEDEDSTEKWTTSDIICKSVDKRTGRPFYTRLRARGVGQQIRGKKMRHQRPDLLIFDDMESRNNTGTIEQRDKNTRWFNRDALKIMDRYDDETGAGQVVVAGTIVHPESRLNRLKRNTEIEVEKGEIPTWKMQFYRAADNWKDFTNPLWPERFGKDWLESEMKVAIANDDMAGLLQEFFNEPIDTDQRKFKESYFAKKYDTLKIENYYGTLTMVVNSQRFVCRLSVGLDIGGWEDRGSDYTAIVVGACIWNHIDRIHEGYVLEAYNERLNPTEIIDLMFDISHRFQYEDQYGHIFYRVPWTVETNAFQTMLYHFVSKKMAERNDFSVRIAYEEHESKEKKGRILSLEPVFKTGFYNWGTHLDWLVQRFVNYGLASDVHDDVEDAFEKMHRNISRPMQKQYDKLRDIKPVYIKPVEPEETFNGSWVTL
jgi:hypothetical protein